jgi:soluble lytic murein transglycosylase-like protein
MRFVLTAIVIIIVTIIAIFCIHLHFENISIENSHFKKVYTARELITLAKPYETEDIPVELIVGLILTESGGRVFSKSPEPASCCGLVQLHPNTAKELGVQNIWDPNENVQAGVKYLQIMMDLFGSEKLALAAYNQGPGALLRNNLRPYSVTHHYVEKVLNETERIRQLIIDENL